MNPPRLILASTSRYRADLLQRLRLPFETAAPGTDEAALPDEAPAARAQRLALAKAAAVAAARRDALVIGSDQVAALGDQVLDKPGDLSRARAQLRASSGRQVVFHTALCLFDSRHGTWREHLDRTVVQFRPLDEAAIERYLQAEQPFDCAGSFKCEGLGISLFERIDNQDPSALVGLPLIALARLLRGAGLALP